MIGFDIDDLCSESLSAVEGYLPAVLDSKNVWHLHHKVGGVCNRTKEKLVELGLYYRRPANELVFLPPDIHSRLHGYLRNNPVERERMRREELANAYAKGRPLEPWILSEDECKILNYQLSDELDKH